MHVFVTGSLSGALEDLDTLHAGAGAAAAARKHGVSAYVGDGLNRWPAVHRLDAADLFRLALEQAPAGTAVHGAAENVTLRSIAEQVGRSLAIPAVSLTPEQAVEHFGDPFLAGVFAADAPVSSDRTRGGLGWTPIHPTLLEDIEAGDYCAPHAL